MAANLHVVKENLKQRLLYLIYREESEIIQKKLSQLADIGWQWYIIFHSGHSTKEKSHLFIEAFESK